MTIFLYQLAQACPHNVLHVLVALHAIISGSVMVWKTLMGVKMIMRAIWQVSGEASVKYCTLYLDPVKMQVSLVAMVLMECL